MSDPFVFFYIKKKTIKMCDGETGECLKEFKSNDYVIHIALTSDSSTLVASGHDSFTTWDVDTGKELKTFRSYTSFTDHISCFAVSSDDRTVVVAIENNTIEVWDLFTGTMKMKFPKRAPDIISIAISPSGEIVVSGSKNGWIRIWALTGDRAGRHIWGMDLCDTPITYAFFTGLENRFVCGGVDSFFDFGDISQETDLYRMSYTHYVNSVTATLSGDIFFVSQDRSIQMRRWVDGREFDVILEEPAHPTDSLYQILISPDEKHIITFTGPIIKWRSDNLEKVRTFVEIGDQYYNERNALCCLSALFSDCNIELKISGKIINCSDNIIVCKIGLDTEVKVNDNTVIIYEQEIVAGTINASDSSKAGEWKYWILAVQRNLSLPKQERLKTGTGIMTRYKSDWLQVMNITESAKVQYLPKNAINLVMYYIYK